ncbi:hypothetical protein quinque_011974 [Culex quinquefasciatus]
MPFLFSSGVLPLSIRAVILEPCNIGEQSGSSPKTTTMSALWPKTSRTDADGEEKRAKFFGPDMTQEAYSAATTIGTRTTRHRNHFRKRN